MNNKFNKKNNINEKNKNTENKENFKKNKNKYFFKNIDKSMENIKEFIIKNPISSTLLSLSIGFILGYINKKK